MFRKHFFGVYASAYVTYVFGFPGRFEVTLAGGQRVALSPLRSFEYKPVVPATHPCKKRLCFDIDEQARTALMTVRSFAYYGKEAEIFQKFVDDAFRALKANGVKALVIDVRHNTGGWSAAVNYLLRHLAKEPFRYWADDSAGEGFLFKPQAPHENRFEGKIFVLSNGDTVSAAPHFLSLVKFHKMGTIVGEEAGASHHVNDNAQRFESTNNGIVYFIARSTFKTAVDGYPRDKGIAPDVAVSYSIQDLIDGKDPAMEYAIARSVE